MSKGDFQKPLYLDYHATTPVDSRVLEAMLPYFTTNFGNPASRSHPYGWQASEAVEIARQQVSDLLSVIPQDIIFTSGATEGLNFALKGLAESSSFRGKHIISFTTEHHAVLDPLHWLKSKGFEISLLPVNSEGVPNCEELISTIRKDTIMVVAMWANNETGVLNDVEKIGAICRDTGTPFVCDATQAVGKIQVHPNDSGIDMLVLSAHKMYGPKGIGAIYLNRKEKKINPVPLIHGGGHENGMRSGTLNVPGIVGLGKASELRKSEMDLDHHTIKTLRDEFEKSILSEVEYSSVNGHQINRLHTVSNIRVDKVDSQAVMTRLRTKLSISSGSACSSADSSPSHVLIAMGLSDEEAKGSFRISLGSPTTNEEIRKASRLLIDEIHKFRAESPVWQMFKQET